MSGSQPGEGAGEPDPIGDLEASSQARMHPSVRPTGEAVAWSALGSLLAGPIAWGGVGFLLDRQFGTGRLLTAIGVVVGSLTAFYIVYLRFGRDDQ